MFVEPLPSAIVPPVTVSVALVKLVIWLVDRVPVPSRVRLTFAKVARASFIVAPLVTCNKELPKLSDSVVKLLRHWGIQDTPVPSSPVPSLSSSCAFGAVCVKADQVTVPPPARASMWFTEP